MPTIIGEKREGGINIRQGKNGILVREEPYHFSVRADSKYQDRLAILSTPGLPTFGTVFFNGLSVKSMSADRDPEDSTRWHVVVTCSTEVEEDQSSNPSNPPGSDPTTWIPKGTATFEPYEIVMRRDFSDPPKPWVNSANRAFETGLVFSKRIATVPFSQFESIGTTTLDTIMARCDCINETEYAGKDPHTLLLVIERATVGTYGGFRCWRIDYALKYRAETWLEKKMDVGYGFYLSGDYHTFYEEQWQDGTYDSGQTGETPFMGLLNKTGGAVTNQKTGDPQFLDFMPYPEIEFNDFLKVLFTTA